MKKWRGILVLAFLFCAGPALAKDSVFPLKDPYGKVLRRYTQKAEYYNWQDLQATLMVYATYASDEFREAFRAEYDKVYPYGQDQRAKERAAPWVAQDPEATFFVALYGRKREMMELGDEKSLQDLSLDVGGKIYKPKEVQKISLTPFELYFFNYLNLWFQGYRVVFPYEGLRDRQVPFSLRIHGVAGGGALKFQ